MIELDKWGWKSRVRWLLFPIIVLLPLAIQAEPTRILSLRDGNEMRDRHCYHAFRNYLKVLGVEALFEDLLLEGKDSEQELRQRLENFSPQLVFALGEEAARLAARLLDSVPTVVGLVRNDAALNGNMYATGVVLEHPPTRQLERIKTLLPSIRKLGVIYSVENREQIQQARETSDSLGLELVTQRVSDIRDLPNALSTVLKRVDALWALGDQLVLTDETTRTILLAAFRNKVPLIGMAPTWTKAGALLAWDWDYSDLGKQCAILAHKVLSGIPPRQLPPEPPRKLLYSLNLKTVQRMKLALPNSVSSNAIAVFQ